MCQESAGSCKTRSGSKAKALIRGLANDIGGTQMHPMKREKEKLETRMRILKYHLGSTPQVPTEVGAENTILHIPQSLVANLDTQQQLAAEPVSTSTSLTLLAQHQQASDDHPPSDQPRDKQGMCSKAYHCKLPYT